MPLRRRIVQMGSVLVAGFSPSLAEDIAQQDIRGEFRAVAVLRGPEDAKPASGGEFFEDKPRYEYLYFSTDTGH